MRMYLRLASDADDAEDRPRALLRTPPFWRIAPGGSSLAEGSAPSVCPSPLPEAPSACFLHVRESVALARSTPAALR